MSALDVRIFLELAVFLFLSKAASIDVGVGDVSPVFDLVEQFLWLHAVDVRKLLEALCLHCLVNSGLVGFSLLLPEPVVIDKLLVQLSLVQTGCSVRTQICN